MQCLLSLPNVEKRFFFNLDRLKLNQNLRRGVSGGKYDTIIRESMRGRWGNNHSGVNIKEEKILEKIRVEKESEDRFFAVDSLGEERIYFTPKSSQGWKGSEAVGESQRGEEGGQKKLK